MATRDSLVFAAKIFDYLEARKQELKEESVHLWKAGRMDDIAAGEIAGARYEINKFYKWLQEH